LISEIQQFVYIKDKTHYHQAMYHYGVLKRIIIRTFGQRQAEGFG
jgi:hypothetical protein